MITAATLDYVVATTDQIAASGVGVATGQTYAQARAALTGAIAGRTRPERHAAGRGALRGDRMADAAVYGFLPWVRTGLASMAKTAPTQNFVNLGVSAHGQHHGGHSGVRCGLFGPGQVTGIDPRAIARMEPKPGAVSFEPNYFPARRVRDAGLSMDVLAGCANGAALRPWLCLVCVKVQPGVAISLRGDRVAAAAILVARRPGQRTAGPRRDHDVGARADLGRNAATNAE